MAGGFGIQERYLSARNTSNLRLVVDNTGSADVLIAAGLAARGSERKTVALAVWGVLATENMRGAHLVSELMAGWLRKRSYQAGDRIVLKHVVAADIAMTVLKWCRTPACPACNGHGHPLRVNAPVIDELRDCTECHGTGKIDLARVLRHEHVEQGRWLAAEIELLCTTVFGDIARRLRPVEDE